VNTLLAANETVPVIDMKHVRKIYPPRSGKGEPVRAIEDISLTVSRGEFVSVVGPSGCGKSTLLKMLAGLLPITSGAIRVNGQLVRGPHSDIGIVFQAPVLLKWRSVLDNVLFPADILRQPRKHYIERAEELLRLVDLWEFRHEYPRVLSGGMQQRVALCRALLHDPSLLVMDEPFSALDALTREEMNMELLRVWSQRQKTVLFITHSIPEAVFLSDRVIVLSPRPSIVDSVFTIDLPRPRTQDVRYTPAFQDYTREIRNRIGVVRHNP
jgi:NitT/TauT family transport system ATP-binding protein